MGYESLAGDLTLVLTGESLITRALSPFREDGFLRLIELLRAGDVTFTDAEMLFHDYEGCPGVAHTGTWMRADPSLIGELKWAGIDLCATAMNHAYDFGETGVLVNIANLKKHGMVYAGTGENLALARAPGYLDTPKGRVALVAACDTMRVGGAKAVDQRPDMKGKPGVNLIAAEREYTVDHQAFADLTRIGAAMGFGAAARGSGGEGVYRFGSGAARMTIREGDRFGATTLLDERDLADNMKWIREARKLADWVLYSFHSGFHGAAFEDPADHVVALAHAAIDAGADVFVGHGSHSDKGIELYRGKPIFYSLGDFILQNDTVLRQPADAYALFGLGADATPGEFYDARSGTQTRGQDVKAVYWQTAVATVRWRDHRLEEIRLTPVDLGMGLPRGQRGRPMPAEPPLAGQILERFQRMSAPFGTRIEIVGDCGVITAG